MAKFLSVKILRIKEETMTRTGKKPDNKHYLSDVIFGAALGIAIGVGFNQEFQKGSIQKIDDGGIIIKNGYLIKFSWSF